MQQGPPPGRPPCSAPPARAEGRVRVGGPGAAGRGAAGTGGVPRKEAGEGGPVPGAEGVGAAPRAPETLQPHSAAPPPQGSSLPGELRAPRSAEPTPGSLTLRELPPTPWHERLLCFVRCPRQTRAGCGDRVGPGPPDPRWPRDCPGPHAYPRPLRLGTWSQLSSRSHTLLGTLAGRPSHFRK